MTSFLLRRLAVALPTSLGAVFIVFLLMFAVPGDPAVLYAGPDTSEADLEAIRSRLGLDAPFYVQFGKYLLRLLQGDMGDSVRNGIPVWEAIVQRFPATLELTFAALLVAASVGTLIGIASAVWHNTWIDDALMLTALVGISLPAFWLGLLLILLFSNELGLFPPSGRGGPMWTWSGLHYLVLPAATLALSPTAYISRLVRSGMLEALSQDFVRTAVSKGLSSTAVVLKHALRTAALPVVTFIGIQVGTMLANAVVVETVFSWPGLSRLVVTSVFARDWPMVQGSILVLALSFIVLNILVDLSYSLIDPRIRYA